MIPYSDADTRHRSFPTVNVLLIALSALVFLYELQLGGLGLLGGGGDLDISAFFGKWGFIADELTQGQACTYRFLPFGAGPSCTEVSAILRDTVLPDIPIIPLQGGGALQNIASPVPTWATIFSSMFIHGGALHFAANMMFLWVFGDNVEDWLGHIKYLIFYLLAGVAATLSQWAIDPSSQTPLIGASGAISGVMGAYILLYPFNRINALIIFYFITVVRLPAVALLGLWFIWQLVQGLGSLAISDQVSVAFFAHVGGFVCGAVMAGGYKLLTGQPLWPSRRQRQPWDYWYRTGRGPD